MLMQPWVAGLIPALLFAVLCVLAQQDEDMQTVFVGALLLCNFVVGILLLVKAFGEGIGTGVLCFIFPPYALYFAFSARNDSAHLKFAYAAVLLGFGLLFAAIPEA